MSAFLDHVPQVIEDVPRLYRWRRGFCGLHGGLQIDMCRYTESTLESMRRMKTVLFAEQCAVVAAVGLALGVSLPASAVVTLDVVASSAPNVFGSASWSGYVVNALNSLEINLGNIGNRATDPTAYEVAGQFVQPGDFIVTTFNSWRGTVSPAAPFSNELGNRMHFGLHAYGDGTTQFKLEDLTFAVQSSDSGNSLGFTGNFIGSSYNGTTRYGINWGADRTKGGGDDINYTSGNGQTLVDELVYVGVGNGLWPGGPPDPNPGNPAGGAQAAMDETVNWILGNAPFTITAQYWIQGDTGSDSVTVVPEPTTIIAGALLLLPFGASTLRLLRRKR
jgi:hypothetical protein